MRNVGQLLLIFIAIHLGSVLMFSQAAEGPQGRIDQIRVIGNHRIPESTVLYYITSKVGEVYDEARLRRDYRSLLETGLFEDIRLETEQTQPGHYRITFAVIEPPVIQEVTFEGLKEGEIKDLENALLERRLSLSAGSPVNAQRLDRAVRAIRDFLHTRGFPLSRVDLDRSPAGPAGVRLVFRITRGPGVRIGEIGFEGNTVLTDEELREALKLTRRTGWLTRFRGVDRYVRERLRYDIESNLLPLYQARGYLFAKTGEPEAVVIERSGDLRYLITVTITEGDVYRVSGFRLNGAAAVDAARFYDFQPGEVMDMTELRSSNERLKQHYASQGYLDMHLTPELRPDHEKKTVALSVNVTEGDRYLIGKIEFRGNNRTRDKVLRREFFLEEGELFDASLLDRSILHLNNLGFLEPVEPSDYEVVKHRDEGEADIIVRVTELDPHSINLTGGLGGISGPYIGVHYQSRNFRGLGQQVEADLSGGTKTSNYSLSWTDPYWLDTRLSLGLTGYHRRLRFDTFGASSLPGFDEDTFSLFTEQSTGFQTRVSYPVGEWTRVGASYALDNNKVYDFNEQFRTFALEQLILLTSGGTPEEAAEGIVRSQLSPFMLRSTRNRLFGATKGTYLFTQLPVSGGALGGLINVIHPYFEYHAFVRDPFTDGRGTWAFRLQGEHVAPYGTLPGGERRTVPFLERVYLGGEFNLRGFDLRSVSPLGIFRQLQVDENGNPVVDPITGLQKVTENLVNLGGDTGGVLTAEYRFPVYGPLQLTGFVDVGTSSVFRKQDLQWLTSEGSTTSLVESSNNVWRVSTGAEIQFMVPLVNQPFRVIFAYNPRRLDTTINVNDRAVRFQEPRSNVKFSIGYSF